MSNVLIMKSLLQHLCSERHTFFNGRDELGIPCKLWISMWRANCASSRSWTWSCQVKRTCVLDPNSYFRVILVADSRTSCVGFQLCVDSSHFNQILHFRFRSSMVSTLPVSGVVFQRWTASGICRHTIQLGWGGTLRQQLQS